MSEEQPVIEETSVPEQQGLLGGKSTYETKNGITIINRIPTCDRCHRLLGEANWIYCTCEKKVCKECAVRSLNDNIYYCLDCVEPYLSKPEYLVLFGFEQLLSRREVAKFAHIQDSEFTEILNHIIESGLLAKKGVRPFSKYEVTHTGYTGLATFRQVYGEHPDVLEFVSRITKENETKR